MWKPEEYPRLVYTKTVLIGSSNSKFLVLFTSEQLKIKWCSGSQPWQVKKSSKLIFSGVYYLTVLVYTKTTIHLSVSG